MSKTDGEKLDSRGFKFRYSSGIAPLITTNQYTDLIKNYKATGQFPHILKLGGMAIDTSRNRNKWRVPMEDLESVAAQLVGAPVMKNHDIDNVDSIIGKVEQAWVEPDKDDKTAGKVMWAGEISDENLIQKILLGYVKFNSIQIAVPNAYCDNCMSANGKSEEQAAIDNLDMPCPRCGSLDMLIRHPMVLEQSMVAIPAYEKAEVSPVGFKASLDKTLQKRFDYGKTMRKAKSTSPDLRPLFLMANNAIIQATIGVAEIQLRMANIRMEEMQNMNDSAYPTQIRNESPKQGTGGSLKDFPLVQKGGEKTEGGEWTPEMDMDLSVDYDCPKCHTQYSIGANEYDKAVKAGKWICMKCGYEEMPEFLLDSQEMDDNGWEDDTMMEQRTTDVAEEPEWDYQTIQQNITMPR